MADRTSIEWTEATWNPTTGCDRVSVGCDHCYALTMAGRLKAMGSAKYQHDGDPRTSGPGFGLSVHRDALELPLRWRDPRVVFVNSMSDLFHPEVPDAFVRDVFDVMQRAGRHTFQLLTKRPQRMALLLRSWVASGWEPPPNVWLGTSVESDRYAWRADHLRVAPAAVRFLSLEPLLEPLPNLVLDEVDWVIVGGESGLSARPIDARWVRELRDKCIESDVAFFFKQWGGRTPKANGRSLDGRIWDQMPVQIQAGTPDVSVPSAHAN
jgi:protein gp37